MELRAAENDDNRRLDRVLRKALDGLALSAIHRLLRTGKVRINGKKAGGDFRVRAGDTITVEGCENTQKPPARDRQKAGDGLSVLYEGGGILIINKPSGTAVHGENGLDSLVQSYLEAGLPPSLSFRAGPLHRLDVPTSGVLVFSSSLNGAREFTRLLKERKLKKYYLAVVQGEFEGSETWEDMLVRDRKNRTSAVVPDGDSGTTRAALTLARSLMTAGGFSLLLLEIRSGRTHQIRSQAASRGHPLWGDVKYGGTRNSGGLLLHAVLLVFPGEDEAPGFPPYCFAPPPPRFLETAKRLFHCSEDELSGMLAGLLQE
ncbi:MAG: RluA family pseudouridine synthase [Spirochaetaceae bacterium]|jgi:23S rRNA pseudouridine955/2504/2580 synthase|nr:RluA family pseudouridine synthase [Spirochaetaceae bacterium]